MQKEKAPKRENLYNVTICWPDPDNPKKLKRVTWHRIDADNNRVWNKTAKDIKRLYPQVIHVNLYGGITEFFKRRIKF